MKKLRFNQMTIGETLFILLSLSTTSASQDFYCPGTNNKFEEVLIDRETYGTIYTLEKDQKYYTNNKVCVFRYNAPKDHRVQLTVESSNLQWSPSGSICDGYDHVSVKDGLGTIVSWCGNNYPREIISRDGHIEITFKTDESNPKNHNYRGAVIQFTAFNKSSCPPDWLSLHSSCYIMSSNRKYWDAAQNDCNLRQGNLLKIDSWDEFSFLFEEILNFASEDVWTGLNDIIKNGQLRWLDRSPFMAVKWLDTPLVVKFDHCGILSHSNRNLFMKPCENVNMKFKAICEANQINSTTLYDIPQSKTDKGSSDDNTGAILKGVGITLAVVVCIVVLIIFIRRQCCQRSIRREVC